MSTVAPPAPVHAVLAVGAHLAIALAYALVGWSAVHFAMRRSDPTNRALLWAWALLLWSAAFAHLLEPLARWLPVGSLLVPVWTVLALQALVTAGIVWRLVPRALSVPGRRELQDLSAALAREVAEKEQAQAALREHHTRLEREVAARTADLEQAKEALQREIAGRESQEQKRLDLERQIQHGQKLESLGLLAGGIAHDFNNLLMGILGNVDLALLQIPEGTPGRQRLDQIRNASLVAADLTKQMLAYAGKGRMQTKPVQINLVLDGLSQLLLTSVPKKAALRLALADDLPWITADAAQVHQVVMNLITNAGEAVGEKLGTITLSTGTMDADAAYLETCYPREPLPAGRYVYLEVEDTGGGMDAATQERIFEPFFTTKFTGRGLGLSAVLGIMRGHQGAVHVDSAPGRGTRIRVLFPPSGQGPEEEQATAHPTRYQGRGATLLVIDDEPMVRTTMSEMLKNLGFLVLTAADGAEGLELYRANKTRIAAVLLDMTMPRMNGEETFRELRRIQPNVRAILCSGYSEQEAADRFSGQGIAGFLQKPFGLDNVSARLHEVLGAS